MAGKSIKAKAYKKNRFEKTRECLKLNYKYPEFSVDYYFLFHVTFSFIIMFKLDNIYLFY